MKITDLTENDVIHIRNKKEAKGIVNLIGHPFELKHIWEINFGKNTAYFPQTHLIDDVRECAGLNIIPASRFLKPSLKKRVKEDTISQVKEDPAASNIEVHFDEVEKLPEKWCVKHYPETLEWIRNNAEQNGSHIYESCYYMFPANGSGNNSSNVKPDGYTEISFETFMKFVYKQDEKPVELEAGKWYKSSDGVILNFNGKRDSDGDPRGYAVFKNKWFEANSIGWRKINWQPATDEEVKEALIKEAERRGFKEGVDYKAVGEHIGKTYTLDDSEWRHNIGNKKPSLCKLGLGRIFYDGKWAEIISEPEAIDFSKAGQLVKSIDGAIVVTDGNHKNETFSGMRLFKNVHHSEHWAKSKFTLCTEPVTLSN